MVPSVSLSAHGFSQRKGRANREVAWSDVREVWGVSFSKLTYEEHFLLIVTSGEDVAIGELDDGFRAFDVAIRSALIGFPPDWYERVEAAGGVRVRLWSGADFSEGR